MLKQRKIIGIVGGLGPFAHLDFERKLLEAAQRLVGAARDQEYPEWILSSAPQTPDRTLAREDKAQDPVPALLRSIRRLERGSADAPGADFVVIPCNAAHQFLPRLRQATALPILDMIEEAALRVSDGAGRVVGVLGTTGTLEARLYHRALDARGMTAVTLLDIDDGARKQRDWVMGAIYGAWRDGAHTDRGIKSVEHAMNIRNY